MDDDDGFDPSVYDDDVAPPPFTPKSEENIKMEDEPVIEEKIEAPSYTEVDWNQEEAP